MHSFDDIKEMVILLVLTSRPLGWFFGSAFALAGMVYAGLHPLSNPALISTLAILALSFPLCLLTFGINDIYDIKSDSINARKKNPLYGVRLRKKRHSLIFSASILCALLILLIYFFSQNPQAFFASFALVLLSYFYSAPPIRLKEIPLLDSLSNGFIFFAAFACGYALGADISTIPLRFLWASLAISAVHALGAAVDYDSDKKCGQTTIATYFGKRNALALATLMCLTGLYLGNFSGIFASSAIFFCTLSIAYSAVFPKHAWIAFRAIFIAAIASIVLVSADYLISGVLP